MTKYLLLFALVMNAAVHAAGPEPKYKAPRTADGHPDLQGVWNFSSNVSLERPSSFADKTVYTRDEIEKRILAKENALKMVASIPPVCSIGIALLDHTSYVDDLRTSLITYPANGKLPPLAEGVSPQTRIDQVLEALADVKGGIPPELVRLLTPVKRDSYEDFGPTDRCLISAPSAPLVPDLDANYLQIIQSRTHVALLSDTDRRVAPLDRRPQLSARLRTWSGDARAHWDGDTLIVETRNFNNRTHSFAAVGLSTEKSVTERFTRRSATLLDYEATISDPKTFQDKVVIAFPMALRGGRVYENSCHEHNYSLANSLSALRKEERDTK